MLEKPLSHLLGQYLRIMGAGRLKCRFQALPPWPPLKIHSLRLTESAFLTSTPGDSNTGGLRTSLREQSKFHELGLLVAELGEDTV